MALMPIKTPSAPAAIGFYAFVMNATRPAGRLQRSP